MRLRILGCSGGIGAGLSTTSYLLDETILVDCGTGVGRLTHPEMQRIRHVFLTHSHLDHVGGLPLLVDTLFDVLDTPLVVHGQEETIKAMKDHVLNGTIWPDFAELPDAANPVMTYRVHTPGEKVEVNGKTFEMIPVLHAVPAVAYYVSGDGRAFCFSGDTSTNDSLWKGLNERERLDFLLVECGFPNENERVARLAKHYTPALLARDLQKLRHRPVVAITHMKPGAEDRSWSQCEREIRGTDLLRVRHDETYEI